MEPTCGRRLWLSTSRAGNGLVTLGNGVFCRGTRSKSEPVARCIGFGTPLSTPQPVTIDEHLFMAHLASVDTRMNRAVAR
jgi:hypothetical protein